MKSKKVTITSSLFLFFLLLALSACNKKEKELSVDATKLIVSDFQNSDCLGTRTYSPSESNSIAEVLNIKLIGENLLLFEHKNAVFNCCPGELFATAEMIEGNVIKITEDSTNRDCRCDCTYTLNYKISSVREGNYTVEIKGYEPFQLAVESGLELTIVLVKSK